MANDDMKSLKEMLQRLIDMQLNSHVSNGKGDNVEANASEELQATLNELQEVYNCLAQLGLERTTPGSCSRASFDDSVLCCDGTPDNKVQVKELKEEIAMLNKELEKRDAIIETFDSRTDVEYEHGLIIHSLCPILVTL
ncbi:hypothetical protein OSTOST_16598, partial [Ostertagia ostertagi]